MHIFCLLFEAYSLLTIDADTPEKTFDFARQKRIEAYRLIETQTGVVEPELM